jgi:hypothetical protein
LHRILRDPEPSENTPNLFMIDEEEEEEEVGIFGT